MKHNLHLRYSSTLIFILFILSGLLLTACGGAPPPKTYTIGIAGEFAADDILGSFKAQMTELGYVEGENVTYIYHGALGGGQQENEVEIKSLIDQKADLLLTLGTMPAKVAKKAVEGTDLPVVFAPITDPVGEGILANIRQPGGNLTGIQTINSTPKALEWLLKIAPGTKQVYAPYHAADQVALMSTKPLPDVAAELGVELILDEVSSGDEVLAALKTLPKDSAILLVTSPSLDSSLEDILKLAIELRIPAGSTTDVTGKNLLFSYPTDLPQTCKQAAVLVDKIFKGNKPGNLPVETTEFLLIINLKTAEAIGLDIPDSILRQASSIVR